ncbi:MAG: SUMF1/EgtB/PvdO family nonheme iron enzyme [Haliscomenobacter sp.]|uniref:SUMF1/EgtB/PvdO family nonheme iron enzyme n=1 Tax=Haliscomenobacter sp. TaxID=2717303 RepID=UPI0029B46401|nr:SUMF1/EgtB/PvdO family nonheme iron enzyme [Haliscomenobacter sp.]MDX2066945.1 SUMF1/EgtB/PvdO family nonheme iron enzyme [Haliscomenobacter sp.]
MSNTQSSPNTNSPLPYRYPGVQPFSSAQSGVFYGRDQEIQDLYRLIRREALVVLYGKSGLGKSSLLNAGILPRCQKEGEFEPLVIKFGAWTEEKSDTPLDITKAYLSAEKADSPILSKILPTEASLWRCAKNRQLQGGGRLLLVFDQFEELFTYPEAAVRAFRQELAELLLDELPLRYQRLLEGPLGEQLSSAEEAALEAPLGTHVLFAIRSDRMHLLHQLAEPLPTILRNLFELRALQAADAEAAIVKPAQQSGSFCTPPFTWSAPALQALLHFLQDPQDDQRVEGILLQLLCQYIEEKWVEKEGIREVGLQHLGDLEQIIANYYHDKLAVLPDEASHAAARKLIEEGLVMEGENIRLSLHEAQIARQYGVDADLLELLVNSRLLRAEPFLRGGYTYELAHDRLVAPVLRAKEERLAQEKQLAEAAARQEAAQKLAEEQRKRRQANRIAIGGITLAVIAVISLIASLFTLRNLEQATAKVVLSNLKEAEGHILDLNYAAALQKMGDAAKLGAAKREVALAMLEVAFWYTEIGEFKRAGKILRHALRLDADRATQAVLRLTTGQKSPRVRELLRQAIKTFDAKNYKKCWNRYYPEMIKIKGGSFMMGCDEKVDSLCQDDVKPRHKVTLDDFAMAKTETTVWQWHLYCKVMGLDIDDFETASWEKAGDNPKVNIEWYEAVEYANWLSERQKLTLHYKENGHGSFSRVESSNGYGLPTEAEWEYAAKGGPYHSPFVYSGSNELDSVAWHVGNSDGRTRSCTAKKPNRLGLYGMSGNALEWCWDWYEENYYAISPIKNPTGVTMGDYRVLRGGSWSSFLDYCRVSDRGWYNTTYSDSNFGFRLVRH